MSDKIQPHHLERKLSCMSASHPPIRFCTIARRSALQYAMRGRLEAWSRIETIDEDLGRSAAGNVERTGFDRMVAEVCLGKVGRWRRGRCRGLPATAATGSLIVCRVVDTVLIDQETVYAPRQSNDRLLLGLKGSLNEYELDLLRQRSLAARYVIVAAPVGYVKTGDRLEKDPDRRVPIRLSDKVMELGMPGRLSCGSSNMGWICLQSRTTATSCGADPAMARSHDHQSGLRRRLCLCKTRAVAGYDGSTMRVRSRSKPRDEWLVLKPGAHEGYVDWDRAEAIRKMVSNNVPTSRHHGAPKHGDALLAGLVRCRRCGRKLTVRYTGAKHNIPRYSCYRGQRDNGEPRCIAFGGLRVDNAIEEALLQVVGPGAIEAAIQAQGEAAERRDRVRETLVRDLEAARYATARAFRQYDATDPANRLVAGELEARWNAALARQADIEAKIAGHDALAVPRQTATPVSFATLADNLQAV